jgi:heat-inducible transcriptional repressor
VRLEVIDMGPTLLVLAVGQHGRVDKQIIDRPEHIDAPAVERSGRRLDGIRGTTYLDAQAQLLRMAATEPSGVHDVLLIAADVLRMATHGAGAAHVLVGGVANLTDETQEWRRDTLRRLVETLEREQDMLHVLREIAPADDVRVTIGDEHPSTGEWGASIVAAPFRAGDATIGTIGIVGPTRMDYLSAMAAVKAVAERLSDATEQEDAQ